MASHPKGSGHKSSHEGRTGKPGNIAGANRPIKIAMRDPELWRRKHASK